MIFLTFFLNICYPYVVPLVLVQTKTVKSATTTIYNNIISISICLFFRSTVILDGNRTNLHTTNILVNNAANVSLKDGRVDELSLEMWDKIFQSDMRGTFYATKCVLPYMQKNPNGGSIINIGSMASCGGDLGSTAYACAKAGVDMLTQSTALQYGKQNIRCNCVRPGLIVTPDNEAAVPQALKDVFLSNIMVNRYGCPEDIGHMCVYLGSDESNYVSGQIINVDGGLNSHVSTVAQFRELNSRTW